MAYRVNGKNLAVARLMPRGKNADPRLKYLHGGVKGTTAVSTSVVARVSLPPQGPGGSTSPTIWPQARVDEVLASQGRDLYDEQVLEEGEPAVTGPGYLVPQIDKVFPDPLDQIATFTVDAEMLIKVLRVACDVTTDANKTVRLRVCSGTPDTLRIDTYCQPGEQEFVAVISETEYTGQNIPGDKPVDAPPKAEVKPMPMGLGLKPSTGRRFRA